ncbi:MAG: iron chaperone [Planctomycetaceae bacterium]
MSDLTGSQEIDAYISQFPKNIQLLLNQIRTTVTKAVPQAEEALKYGIPTLRMKTNLLHYAAFEKHIGLYPTPSGMQQFADELKGWVQGKGSVQLPLDQPLPLDLIRRIALFRAATVAGSQPTATTKKQATKSAAKKTPAAGKKAQTAKTAPKKAKKAARKQTGN